MCGLSLACMRLTITHLPSAGSPAGNAHSKLRAPLIRIAFLGRQSLSLVQGSQMHLQLPQRDAIRP